MPRTAHSPDDAVLGVVTSPMTPAPDASSDSCNTADCSTGVKPRLCATRQTASDDRGTPYDRVLADFAEAQNLSMDTSREQQRRIEGPALPHYSPIKTIQKVELTSNFRKHNRKGKLLQ